MKYKRFLYFIPAVVWMAVIFRFSAQTGNSSGSLSLDICKSIVLVFNEGISSDNLLAHAQALQYPIRKLAHFSEYAFLCLTWIYGFTKNEYPLNEVLMLSVAISIGWAGLDEFHQAFVPGRAPAVADVLIDSAGALTCNAICWLKMRQKVLI